MNISNRFGLSDYRRGVDPVSRFLRDTDLASRASNGARIAHDMKKKVDLHIGEKFLVKYEWGDKIYNHGLFDGNFDLNEDDLRVKLRLGVICEEAYFWGGQLTVPTHYYVEKDLGNRWVRKEGDLVIIGGEILFLGENIHIYVGNENVDNNLLRADDYKVALKLLGLEHP